MIILTPKKIYNERPDIREKVLIDYPVTSKEKRCPIEASKREALRFERAKRLYETTNRITIIKEESVDLSGATYETK